MGRPIKKKYMGSGAGNQIKVRAKIGAAAEGDGFLVAQKGANRFRVNVGGTVGICQLVAKPAGTLLDNEMSITVLNDANQLIQVKKLRNRTVIDANNESYPWSFAATMTDNAAQIPDVEAAIPAPIVFQIVTQPTNASVVAPNTKTFTVVASNTYNDAMTYQWQKQSAGGTKWVNIAGATASSFTTDATDVAISGTSYRVLVTLGKQTLTSNVAVLTVTAA